MLHTGITFLALVIIALAAAHYYFISKFDRSDQLSIDDVLRPNPGSARKRSQENLPSLVRSFVGRCGVKSHDTVHSVALRQIAQLRMAPEKAWQQIHTQQVVNVCESAFFWLAQRRLGPLPLLNVVDGYVVGNGFLQARLFGSIPIAQYEGAQMSHSELMRYLAELPWAPDAILNNPNLRWRELTENSIEVSSESAGGIATVRFLFNEVGDIAEVYAEARAAVENGKTVMRPWRGEFSEYRILGGRRIPGHAEVGYVYEDGYQPYFSCDLKHYEIITD